jgi:hypothetical protein
MSKDLLYEFIEALTILPGSWQKVSTTHGSVFA